MLAKRALVRIVRTPEGIVIDPTGRQAGRGAYLHDQPSCWARAMKGSLAAALKTTLTAEDRERLVQFARTLPEETTAQAAEAETQ